MKFAHIADCHIGGWRDPKMKELPADAFIIAVDMCIEKSVDFVLISGDLFNTSHPTIDDLKAVVSGLKRLKDENIPIYMIAGSHDFSATGKTMLDVLEEAGLAKNVAKGDVIDGKLSLKFTLDKKTGAKITGMLGKKGMLERHFYDSLEKANIESEDGFKIFMFHTALTELKPKELEKMDSTPISLLPKGFEYYAGGHVHIVEKKDIEGYKNIVYPGPLFPNNFYELETLKHGGFYIYDEGKIMYEKIGHRTVEVFEFSAENKTPEAAQKEIKEKVSKKDYENFIILFRIFGRLKSGKTSDIDFNSIIKMFYDNGAYFVMKNTSKLITPEFEEVQVSEDSVDKIEEKLIDEQEGKEVFEDEKEIINSLMKVMSKERLEDERVADYDKRIEKEVDEIFGV